MIKNKITPVIIFILFLSLNISGQVLIDWNSQWSYFKGKSEPSNPNSQWRNIGFNASAWPKGNAPFRYGDGSGGTELTDMMGNYTTFYIRKEFIINNTDDVDELKIIADYDDGFVLWINGNEVWNINVPDNYAFNSGAINTHEFEEWSSLTLKKEDLNLVNGTNVIAVQGFNFSKTSSDFYLNVKVEGKKNLPETNAVVTSDIKSGFYNSPFWVKLTGSAPNETIMYTMDGSDPRTSSTILTGSSPVLVWIDPNSDTGKRGKTGAVVLRASQISSGLAPGKPTSHSYIFVSAVKTQAHPGGSWPTNNINGQSIDLPMDSKVYNDARYKNLMESSLTDIPTISVTTDPDK
jgi:hypothetical protein